MASMRGFANSGLTSARYTLCSGRIELEREQRVDRAAGSSGMSVVPATAEVNASQSSAAAVTSS